jgi:DNA invertase Pin-like site-specific DNA recombinase
MTTAIYRRVSSKAQTTASQRADLDAYRDNLKANGEEVLEFEDKFTGKQMKRPSWDKLWAAICAHKIKKIVVWRLDRLGRTCAGLSQLFVELQLRKIDLVSLKDGLDLATTAGRLMAHVLASCAQYELEVLMERQMAGIQETKQELARGTAVWKPRAKAGVPGTPRDKYGSGRKPGLTVPKATCELVRRLKSEGKTITEIATVTKLSRPTIYRVLREARAICVSRNS